VRERHCMLLIDAANVVGSRPTGWWRDRAGAVRELVARVREAAAGGNLPVPVVVVVEGAARAGADEETLDGVRVAHASGDGDDALVAETMAAEEGVVLVSADRVLRERVRGLGAETVGVGWLLDRLPT